jgi:hypothetical protein
VEISGLTFTALTVVLVINTALVGVLAVALYQISRKADEAVRKAQPLLDQAVKTLARAEQMTVDLQGRVDRILDTTTQVVDRVTDRVDRTTARAEDAVTEPLIAAASLAAGINQGVRAYAGKTNGAGTGPGGDDG